jgi:aspartyl-tRNA(Asn)/glutamyl-tRNA(Gln) amidotransferase subunit A
VTVDFLTDKAARTFLDATELAHVIRTGQISPVEVVQSFLDRIAEVNPRVNAIVTVNGEAALGAAKSAEADVLSGKNPGPFHGVPFTVKDVIDTAGVPTQRGSRLFAGHIPTRDSTVVARYKTAGAILLAKTNVPEFSLWWETDNLLTGRTNNPWNLDHTPGGSSGGESAAIASGMSPLGLGSDLGISVRGPAALTGIAALKATHGRIPLTGHFPRTSLHFWHIGPLARSVRDIATAFSVLQGPDGIDGFAVYPKSANAAQDRMAGSTVRVGWLVEPGFGPVDPEVAAAVASAADVLKDAGCKVEQVRMPILEEMDPLVPYVTLSVADSVLSLKSVVAGRESDVSELIRARVQSPVPDARRCFEAMGQILRLKSAFADYFGKYDAFLCPVIPFTAPRHGRTEYEVNGRKVETRQMMRATALFNMTGLPALSVPYALSSANLPINVQLVSRWLDEETVLRLGLIVEAGNGMKGRRPAI